MIADWMVRRRTGTLASRGVDRLHLGSCSTSAGRCPGRRSSWPSGGSTPPGSPRLVEGRDGGRGRRPPGRLGRTASPPGGRRSAAGRAWTPALGLARAVPGPGPETVAAWPFCAWPPADSLEADPCTADCASRGALHGQLRTICDVRPGRVAGARASGFYAGFPRCAGSGTRGSRPPRRPGAALRLSSSELGRRRFRPGARATYRAATAPADACDLGAAGGPPFPAGAHGGRGRGRGRAGRAGPGHPGGRRLLHPPDGRAGSRVAGARCLADGAAVWRAARSNGGCRFADVLGCPVSVPGHVESAALGAAVLAGRGAGVLPDGTPPAAGPGADGCAAAGRPRCTAVQPSPARQRAYDDLYAQWISQAYLRSQP